MANGDRIRVPRNQPITAIASVGSLQEATWPTPELQRTAQRRVCFGEKRTFTLEPLEGYCHRKSLPPDPRCFIVSAGLIWYVALQAKRCCPSTVRMQPPTS